METTSHTIKQLIAHASALYHKYPQLDLWFHGNAKAIIICSTFIAIFFIVLIGCLWSIFSTMRGKKLRKELEIKAKQQQETENDNLNHLNDQSDLSFRPNQLYNREKHPVDIAIMKSCEEEEYGLLTPEAQLEYEYLNLLLTFLLT